MSKTNDKLMSEIYSQLHDSRVNPVWLHGLVDNNSIHLTDKVVGYGSLIEMAARFDRIAVIQILLKRYDTVPKEAVAEYIRKCISKALVYSCVAGSYMAADILIRHHADTNYGVNKKYRTPLTAAAGEGAISVIELLLKSGADINATDKFGRTPLYSAMLGVRRNTHPLETRILVKYLLKHGADPTIDPTLKSDPLSKTTTVALRCGWDVGVMVHAACEHYLNTESPESELPNAHPSPSNCISCDTTEKPSTMSNLK